VRRPLKAIAGGYSAWRVQLNDARTRYGPPDPFRQIWMHSRAFRSAVTPRRRSCDSQQARSAQLLGKASARVHYDQNHRDPRCVCQAEELRWPQGINPQNASAEGTYFSVRRLGNSGEFALGVADNCAESRLGTERLSEIFAQRARIFGPGVASPMPANTRRTITRRCEALARCARCAGCRDPK